jgi:DNA polymerase-3 subunit epsilon
MREVVLDTETTGLDPALGHRVVEVGCVELINHVPSGRSLQLYINPDREMPADAFEVHGLSDAFLADKPRFHEVVDRVLAFLGDSPLVIHNAGFDLRFLNAELAALDLPPIAGARAIDTVQLARAKYPGAPASLDALCRRFAIDASARSKHGALLDAELLAEVYLELIGARQAMLGLAETARSQGETRGAAASTGGRPQPLAPRIGAEAREEHRRFIATLGAGAIWRAYRPDIGAEDATE